MSKSRKPASSHAAPIKSKATGLGMPELPPPMPRAMEQPVSCHSPGARA